MEKLVLAEVVADNQYLNLDRLEKELYARLYVVGGWIKEYVPWEGVDSLGEACYVRETQRSLAHSSGPLPIRFLFWVRNGLRPQIEYRTNLGWCRLQDIITPEDVIEIARAAQEVFEELVEAYPELKARLLERSEFVAQLNCELGFEK